MSPSPAATQPTTTQHAAHAELRPEESFNYCGFQTRAAGAPACTRGSRAGTEECLQQATAVAPPVQCSTTAVPTEHEVGSIMESRGVPGAPAELSRRPGGIAAHVDARQLNRMYQQRHRARVKVRVCYLSTIAYSRVRQEPQPPACAVLV